MQQINLFPPSPGGKRNWSPLPQLPLRGVDTPYVESLFSYVMRLAYMCNAPINNFAKLLYEYGGKSKTKYNVTSSTWIGPNTNYLDYLNPLMELTDQHNLYKGTFHCVSNVLHGSKMVTKHSGSRIWCPNCYLDWNHHTSYEPLYWAFTIMPICPIHNVYMESKCPSCQKYQPTVTEYKVRRLCHYCKSKLGNTGIKASTSNFDEWIKNQLLSFCGYIQRIEKELPLSRYIRFIDGIKKRDLDGEVLPPIIKDYIKMSKLRYIFDSSIPTIDFYLNLCAFQSTTIEDILENPEGTALKPLFDRSNNFTNIPFVRRDTKFIIRRSGLIIRDLLEHKDSLLIPYRLLIKRLGVSVDNLKEYHPDLREKYKARLAKEFDFTRRYYQTRTLIAIFEIMDANKDGLFEILDQNKLMDIVAEKTNIIHPFVKSCIDTASTYINIEHKYRDIGDGAIEQDKEITKWINGFNTF